jgi:tetratricopeptide (TPR) repeat protein
MKSRVVLFLVSFGLVGSLYASESAAQEPAQPPAKQDAETRPAAPQVAPVSQEAGKSDAQSKVTETVAVPAEGVKSEEAVPSGAPAEPEYVSPTDKDEINNLMKYAQSSSDDGRLDMALIAYRQLLSKPLNKVQQRIVLLGYARILRRKTDLTKAAAVYEKVLKDYPMEEDTPEIYLELGRTHRALGAYKSAITRFYSVINSTIKLPEDGASKYRQLAKTAQFEIAETYFLSGNFAEASRFYSRLRLLDLAQLDRAKAHFKAAYSLSLAEDHLGAVTALRAYIDQNPDDENVPEAHYLLAISYRRLARPLEALVEALELLRMEKTRTAKDPKRWAFWQRKTGNQIANEFFEQGDFPHALTIYQTLAELYSEISWRLPVLYQMGLCHERLGQMDQAISCYQSILDNLKSAKGDGVQQSELSDLSRMASWRLSQIGWQHSTEQSLYLLLPQQHSLPPPPATKPKNDASGNPPAAPTPVR